MITIIPGWFKHRDLLVKAWTDGCDNHHQMVISNIRVICIQLDHSDDWWIIAANRENDDKFDDLGPYDTAEVAVTMLRLHATMI
jgi:hypothetical protein